MPSFLLRRLLSSFLVLFFAVSLTFMLTRLLPGGPFDREKGGSAKVEQALQEKYKLNGTLWQQYSAYMRALATFDLGDSTKYLDWRVSELLAQKMPTSLTLGMVAFIIASIGGVLLGAMSALWRDTWVDRTAMIGALVAISSARASSPAHCLIAHGGALAGLAAGGRLGRRFRQSGAALRSVSRHRMSPTSRG
jgi:oligopeptide transport system permease protein